MYLNEDYDMITAQGHMTLNYRVHGINPKRI